MSGLDILQPTATASFDLDDVRIASPCNMKWQDMTGGERVRHCAACQKSVFNLSGMKRSEALDLLRATEGKICARFYRRKDGTILTADCSVGVALLARKTKRAVIGAAIATLGAVGALLAFLASAPATTLRVNAAQRDLIEKRDALVVPAQPHHAVAGGLAYDPRMEMGEVAMPEPVVENRNDTKK